MKDKLQCKLCDKILFSDERLEAQHPFISEDCDSPVSGGTPTEDGYKHLCYQHLRKYL